MKKIWEVEFGNYTKIDVVAINIKEAIKRARSQRRGEYWNRIQDITKVELLAEGQ